MTDETKPATPAPTQDAVKPDMINTSPAAPVGIQDQGIQKANDLSQAKSDQIEAAAPGPVRIEGMKKDDSPKKFGERLDPGASTTDSPRDSAAPAQQPPGPVAAPINQIAPVSSTGETTSARESPKLDVPSNAQVPQTAGAGVSSGSEKEPAPSAPPASSPEVPPAESPQAEPETEFGKPIRNIVREEPVDPFEEANNLLKQIPGKMRLY